MKLQRARKRAALLGVALLATTSTAGAAYAVTGPAATDPALAFSVQLSVGDGVRGCSGVLVNRWWVATAKSCFGTEALPATTATIGRLDLTKTGGYVRTVDKVVAHPERDLVLARLAEAALGATAVKIGTSPPAAGDTLVAAGFGRTADTWVPDALHTGEFTVSAVGACLRNITSSLAGSAFASSGKGLCATTSAQSLAERVRTAMTRPNAASSADSNRASSFASTSPSLSNTALPDCSSVRGFANPISSSSAFSRAIGRLERPPTFTPRKRAIWMLMPSA